MPSGVGEWNHLRLDALELLGADFRLPTLQAWKSDVDGSALEMSAAEQPPHPEEQHRRQAFWPIQRRVVLRAEDRKEGSLLPGDPP